MRASTVPHWMIDAAAVALPDPAADPDRVAAAAMARLLRQLRADVGRGGIALIRPEELDGLAELLDPPAPVIPAPRRPVEFCPSCRVLGGHLTDCLQLAELAARDGGAR